MQRIKSLCNKYGLDFKEDGNKIHIHGFIIERYYNMLYKASFYETSLLEKDILIRLDQAFSDLSEWLEIYEKISNKIKNISTDIKIEDMSIIDYAYLMKISYKESYYSIQKHEAYKEIKYQRKVIIGNKAMLETNIFLDWLYEFTYQKLHKWKYKYEINNTLKNIPSSEQIKIDDKLTKLLKPQ